MRRSFREGPFSHVTTIIINVSYGSLHCPHANSDCLSRSNDGVGYRSQLPSYFEGRIDIMQTTLRPSLIGIRMGSTCSPPLLSVAAKSGIPGSFCARRGTN
jgi:hypothetical protein